MAAMMPGTAQSTSKVIRPDADARVWKLQNARALAGADDLFLFEVSSRHALENPTPINPDNRPGRVLAEIALVFATIGALLLVIWAFLPAGISQ